MTLYYNDCELTKIKGHHKYKHGWKTQKFAHIPVFSRTFDQIPVYSRPGILIIKFQYIPGFPGCVRTLSKYVEKRDFFAQSGIT